MTGLQIFLIIIGILIIITIIILVILFAVGYFTNKNINKNLQGNFSIRQLTGSGHLTSGNSSGPTGPFAGDNIVVSTSTSVPCTGYTWTYQNNFLQTNGLITTVGPVGGNTGSGGTGPNIVDGAPIILVGPTGASDFNQWVFKDDLLRWCLKNNESFCLKNSNGTVVLGQTSFSSITQPEFGWFPEGVLTGPNCVNQT